MKTLEEKIKVMQAYKDGKQIEFKSNICDWTDAPFPCWNWTIYDYRIKEEPKKKIKLYNYLYRDAISNQYYISTRCVQNMEEASIYSSQHVIKLLPHTMIEVEEE